MTNKKSKAEIVRQPLRCQKCNEPFFGTMKVNVEVTIAIKSMLANRCPKCGSDQLYMGLGLSLSEDRERRKKATKNKLLDWLENGEIGESSKDIAKYMMEGAHIKNYPHDYDDLRRCILLLDRFPEWKERMPEMAKFSGWEKIGPQWMEIEAAIFADDPEAKRITKSAEMLKKLFK